MTASAMRAAFDVLQDVTGSPWFDSDEKDQFLYDSMWDIINDELKVLENDKSSLERIRTLIKADTQSTNGSAILLNSVFDGSAATELDPVLVLSMHLASGIPLKFVRQADIGMFEDNTYKAATATYPSYTMISTGYQVYPSSLTTTALDIVYVMQPETVNALPVKTHYEQVAKAMAKTGYTTESQALIMMGESEGVK